MEAHGYQLNVYKKPGEAQTYLSGVHERPENLINTYQVVVYI